MSLVEEIRNDPDKGAKRLDAEFRVGLTTLALRFCNDASGAEDLVNRTFMEVCRSIDRYAEQSAFFAWMSKIMANIHANDIRRKSRQNEVDVNPDGSCRFRCPALNAVYFQLLDERGRCVQTMRSWTHMQPGETASCLGCHESKRTAYPPVGNAHVGQTQELQPAPGQGHHPLLSRLAAETVSAQGCFAHLPETGDIPESFH